MTAPSLSISRDLLEGVRTGDEQALERGFLEIFPLLVGGVAADLDDPSAAARVVERAFLHVLAERNAITDAEGLDLELHRALHSSVARERSRRSALHRFERNEGVTTRGKTAVAPLADPGQVWERIRGTLRDESAEVARRRHTAAAEAQHRAATRMTQAVNHHSRWTMAAIVFALFALCAGGYGLSLLNADPSEWEIRRALASNDARNISAGPGQIGNVTLADESLVKLGAGSTLRVSPDFGDAMRAVQLNGTASFTVAASDHPFELRANEIAISLASGRVDISAETATTLIRVNEGTVRLTTRDSSLVVGAGQMVFIDSTGAVRSGAPLAVDESLAWIDGRFVANGSVGDVVAKLHRWYGADIAIGDGSIADRHASVTGTLGELSPTLRSLERAAGLRTIWKDGRMVLFLK